MHYERSLVFVFVHFIHLISCVIYVIIINRGDTMPLNYKIDVLTALKNAGYTTYKIRKEKLLSESTVQKLRNKQPVAWENIAAICKLLNCQPGDILEYEKD